MWSHTISSLVVYEEAVMDFMLWVFYNYTEKIAFYCRFDSDLKSLMMVMPK